MKNIIFKLKDIINKIIKNFIKLIVSTIIIITGIFLFILEIIGKFIFLLVGIIYYIIKNIKNLKKSFFILLGDMSKNLKNRLNQDCLGKRLIKGIKNILKFKLHSEVIPIITLITAKLYLLLILYLSISDLINM